MTRRIVITGMGCVTPLGSNPDALWQGLTEGKSAVRSLSLFDASQYPVRIAAEVKDWNVASFGDHLKQWENGPRQTQFALSAGLYAAQQAGIPFTQLDPIRFGVYLGCGEAFEDFPAFIQSIDNASVDGQFQNDHFNQSALHIFNPDEAQEYIPHTPASHLSAMLNAQGPNANCISACVSSAQAIGESARLIRRGEADVMLAGGAHSTINEFGLTGFHRLSALSTRNDDPATAVRPFDRERDGFVMGEGAGLFILEELEHARHRGAEIIAELTGYGSTQDAYRVTDSHPQGRGITNAMNIALRFAELNTDDIDYINAHGTGTPMNDRTETLAIKNVFGEKAYDIPISSSKSMMGHATTASGAIEFAVSLLSLQHQIAPPTINYNTPDPQCDLDYVPNIARDISNQHVLTNSIGFGGQNAALIISRFDEKNRSAVSVRRAS